MMTDIIQHLREQAKTKRNPLAARCTMLEAAAAIERLRAELAESQQQAAAYRFIRAGGAYIEPHDGGRIYVSDDEQGGHCYTAEEFDAAIFTAMEASNG